MGRFLIYYSYFGTKYRGVQIQKALMNGRVIPTVQGVLHETLKNLRPSNEYKIYLSSRTDLGVHALKNACHVDLKHPEERKEYNPDVITSVMNYYLKLRNEDVRILETKMVPDDFHSRMKATGRKYVYRLAHLPRGNAAENEIFFKDLEEYKFLKKQRPCLPYGAAASLFEENRTLFLWRPLDIEKLILGAQVISGIHHYGSFTASSRAGLDYQPHPVKMLSIGVKRGQPLAYPLLGSHHKSIENFEFWDIHVRAKSFLYRQIRRVVGAMVLMATNRITVSDIHDLLDNPKKDFPFSSAMGSPEHGLYLLEVEYDPKDLECSTSAPRDLTTSGSSSDFPLSSSFSKDIETKQKIQNLEVYFSESKKVKINATHFFFQFDFCICQKAFCAKNIIDIFNKNI
ncbi:tRNA pseudouridine synthase-like 1 [Bulinus truncatus]|nr:tRNA pseudouridine synthase-like 1 [Bulinus truncatus]